MQLFELDTIGTHLSLQIDTDIDVSSLFDALRERLFYFEEKFSRFRSGNWLEDLNMNRKAILDEDARFMLLFAIDVAQKTDGYFDPTVGKRLTELGYGRQGAVNSEQGTNFQKIFGDYRDIDMVGDEVYLRGDIELEFGGVGKGYLIDVIREMIEDFFQFSPGEEGMRGSPPSLPGSPDETVRFLINFGGDMYGFGDWKVALESPFVPDEAIGIVVLRDDFLACSAGTKRKWSHHHHLINPKTGESAREVVATFIEGVSGILTDSYATVLSVMPWQLACTTLEKTPHIEGVLVRYDGVFYQSHGVNNITLFI